MTPISMIGTGTSVGIFSVTVMALWHDYIAPRLEILTETLRQASGG